ncbi:putative mitochondrial Spliced leader RNA PSE-promoter transcription factor [Leptomonas pyrrhocoris]|uniref:Putative mitochondrial Spliced leader RNA PSE-promoter transcription factor n=1 Tax=Leptomonas pyrrhocoris TaxID=157538 RepID=A0A0M9GB91_LEPPY|nr:putative mitochondrial Spliced leader RNA PSE-promoter transcription factor [Leptomonas pyrrhocoris]KPA86777.1 putative mitochondrial Spliced leader RNA PSE-promoter transcription factor [Leptomonas pyrrhocoris]|eukprot:XP_015665216.1 putative mitochondrial Spliced leader RNA PSE-promoter transcription factor [Leptomonas pyrrhocoris]
MRCSFRCLCSKIDLDGVSSRYYPRFRPRRLVMPVDPSDVHSAKRQPSPLYEVLKAQTRRRRQAERRGVVQLGTVPAERSVGDAFRLMLEACAFQQLFSDTALTPVAVRELEALVDAHRKSKQERKAKGAAAGADSHLHCGAAEDNPKKTTEASIKAHHTSVIASPLYSVAFHDSVVPVAAQHLSSTAPNDTNSNHTLSVRMVDTLWDMLDHTPLNSPVHGELALRGDAVVRTTLLELAYEAYPRLRSRHVQQLLHETTGLLPCGRVAIRIGFAEQCGVEGDIAMWRELNTLSERLRLARKQATVHLQRMEKGVAAQRRWYWRAVLRSAAGRLKLFPVHKEDLLPRLEWIRSSLFAFIAFVEMAEQSGDTQARVKPLISHLFASQLARHVRRRRVLDAAAAAVESLTANANAPTEAFSSDSPSRTAEESAGKEGGNDNSDLLLAAERVAAELARVTARTSDEEEVLEERTHPMNRRADRTRDQYESSGGAHGTQMLHDESLERHAEAHARLAPPLLLHALSSTTINAFKEAQLVLRYAPETSETLRHAPIDVEQAVRRVVDVQETNSYAALHHAQQYRQVEYTVCRLYAGKHCLGEGKGETLMSAMQDASLEMLFRYYFASPSSPTPSAATSTESQGGKKRRNEVGVISLKDGVQEDGDDGGSVPAARIHPPHTEEEILL